MQGALPVNLSQLAKEKEHLNSNNSFKISSLQEEKPNNHQQEQLEAFIWMAVLFHIPSLATAGIKLSTNPESEMVSNKSSTSTAALELLELGLPSLVELKINFFLVFLN